MIILGEIQSAQPRSYTSPKTGVKYDSVQVVVMDRSKAYRCLTPFVFEVPVAERDRVLGKKPLALLTDEKVTLAANELNPANGNVRVRGALHMGHLTMDQIAKLMETDTEAKA